VHAPQYHETLFSRVYPGKQESSPCYLPTVQALERFLAFTPEQRQRTILRTDAGFGSDANINQVLATDWQVLTKNKGGRRPDAYARRVAADAWQDLDGRRQIATLPQPLSYCRPTQSHLLRWWTESGMEKHAIMVCSIPAWSQHELMIYYDQRGTCEKEIQADKVGLHLEKRRKKRLTAQEALILVTDVAHNLLAWTAQWMFPSSSLADYGPLRLVEDVLCLSGHLVFDGERLSEVHLNELHPHARVIATGLEHLFDHFGQP
jgi:Transposase DDE domain group 1